ncbi:MULTISPECIES: NUDIX hydrolase [Prauserella salsuginis group]|uniref:8-oxo-dGTP pyrophosphatase MutT (NUDIX family) n=2 Tax=Prauserella salsuginis group TaxID=2893672 RepID=A0A839XR89_9PSEU|nr:MULTISPECIES: NUDIX domain-containing protein [Prauserella salsuginis group]MBB3662476.1 8-oxo-dGTP pyrophosphatase MutT (NUDIX family) [Prauserella sediminis]MCR3720185.1 ADP-ribose pyrophosphatase YjhB, NUDIX family [Prauserella flava]MCR3734106.1 ADP-ribose pyrophosphatase YjhB, NUDIX family [Prauserella salsuginis]
MPKTDHYDDPDAPAPNRIVPAVTAVVRNAAGELLLIERTDNGLWALPGGAQDLGESVPDAVRREVAEETGITVDVTAISGIYSDPKHVIAYDDGEVRQEFSLCFHARPTGGSLRASAESRRVHWVSPDEIDRLPMDRAMRLRVDHGINEPTNVHLG